MNTNSVPFASRIALQYPPQQHSVQPFHQSPDYPATVDPSLIYPRTGGTTQFNQTANAVGESLDSITTYATQSPCDYASPVYSYTSPAKYVLK